jgi:hypothetical protein
MKMQNKKIDDLWLQRFIEKGISTNGIWYSWNTEKLTRGVKLPPNDFNRAVIVVALIYLIFIIISIVLFNFKFI